MSKNRDNKNIQAWDDLYARVPDYVWGFSPTPALEHFLERIATSLHEHSNILDAATGEGRNLAALLTLPGCCYACDASEHALNKIDGPIRSKVETVSCNLSKLPYSDGFFSFVLLWDTAETLPDLDAALGEISRVLAPGGLLLCNIPDEKDGIASIDMTSLGAGEYLYRDKYFYRFMSREMTEALFQTHGFEIQSAERHQWMEPAHCEFREMDHQHESIVYLAKKRV